MLGLDGGRAHRRPYEYQSLIMAGLETTCTQPLSTRSLGAAEEPREKPAQAGGTGERAAARAMCMYGCGKLLGYGISLPFSIPGTCTSLSFGPVKPADQSVSTFQYLALPILDIGVLNGSDCLISDLSSSDLVKTQMRLLLGSGRNRRMLCQFVHLSLATTVTFPNFSKTCHVKVPY